MFRQSILAPRLALLPALIITLVTFVGSIGFTVMLSFTDSRRFPSYNFVGIRQYVRLFSDENWWIALKNMVLFGVGSLASIVLGFILAAIIARDVRGSSIFRTLFLYPLSISLIVTGLAWRWILQPELGVESFLRAVGITWLDVRWLSSPDTVMIGIAVAAVWQSTGFFMALMISGLKSVNPEIWSAGKLDGVPFWRFYLEVIIPMMRYTFITCGVLLAIGVVRAYDIVVAMTRGGPGTSSYLPAYFAVNAYWDRLNLGYGSAAATLMLAVTLLLFSPFAIRRFVRRNEV